MRMSPDACAVCGVNSGPVCDECGDDWGAIGRTVERWQRAQESEARLRERIAVLVVYLCDERNMSEIQAARLTGVSRPTIRAWRGK
jgi:predicted XRE-type DNA-binding protein